jgi:hypothetical protein
MVITSSWHEMKHALVFVNTYINILSELMTEFVDSIGDLNWWLSNGLGIWESIIQKVGGKIKIDIFVSQFTELVRFFNIAIGKSIQIRTEWENQLIFKIHF